MNHNDVSRSIELPILAEEGSHEEDEPSSLSNPTGTAMSFGKLALPNPTDTLHRRPSLSSEPISILSPSKYNKQRQGPTSVRHSASLDALEIDSNKPSPGGGAKTPTTLQTIAQNVRKGTNTIFGRSSGSEELILKQRSDNTRLEDESFYRSYNVGDFILISTNNRFASSVNRFGFPPRQGKTPEERSGPYSFVLGKIQQIHFEENSKFYIVRREDTFVEIRGYPNNMQPLSTKAGEEAAREAAYDFAYGINTPGDHPQDQPSDEKTLRALLLLPFVTLYTCFVSMAGARLYKCFSEIIFQIQKHSYWFLNGMAPYQFNTRITTVNFVVLCSLWYLFMDQIRLAFIPTQYDQSLAICNAIIWFVLLTELLLEVFIRPDGYEQMVESDKAYAPSTVRCISGIHWWVEFISLAFFTPEFICLFSSTIECDESPAFSLLQSTKLAITGPTRLHAFAGRAFYAMVRFRVFGLVRHWKNMWVNRNFNKRKARLLMQKHDLRKSKRLLNDFSWRMDHTEIVSADGYTAQNKQTIKQEQKDSIQSLINASNIGTALMVTNSYRSLSILCIIMGIFPMIGLIAFTGVVNPVGQEMILQLQGINIMAAEEFNCELLAHSIKNWMASWEHMSDPSIVTSSVDDYLLELIVSPSRCQSELTGLFETEFAYQKVGCEILQEYNYYSPLLKDMDGTNCSRFTLNQPWRTQVRTGNLHTEHVSQDTMNEVYSVTALFNQTRATEYSAFTSLLLQFCLVLVAIGSLVVLRSDAKNFVLGPLRSMLKIVARYAKNPLAQANSVGKDNSVVGDSEMDDSVYGEEDDAFTSHEFQTDETEQLIRAVAKITDLLRKCWGVAGAGIISTNLASRENALAEVFNPTVPGKSVYALFAFAAIKGFDHCLRALEGDIMILINDVAAVLHKEVYRWGFEDSGQCNKNLGEAFLMVFRIGQVKEVLEKLDEATNIFFSTSDAKKINVKKKAPVRKEIMDGRIRKITKSQKFKNNDAMTDAMKLSLQSLPGISTFTDRAVIGMLKSFASIHRDEKLMNYSRDFRLSSGVGAFCINMVFGMDAGWAVEGAVGSEYKIDATYLSPHVNMASRMMSASKYYGVTILLSEAVQELMSDAAKDKLRMLDRVTVKGSTSVQKIFTYDARHQGADFFLFSRSDDMADLDASIVTTAIWDTDQDLKAMRHHITEDFIEMFNSGTKAYLSGDWPEALAKFEHANEIMIDTALEEGYLQDGIYVNLDRTEIKREYSDGPTNYLMNFMKSKGGVAPKGWNGWHPLLSK